MNTSIGEDDIVRKITELASKAFWNGENFNLDNTSVKDKMMLLHGNMIAWVENDNLVISSRGWNTNTTKERLNGVLMPLCKKIYQVKGKWYLHDGNDGGEIPFFDGMEIKL